MNLLLPKLFCIKLLIAFILFCGDIISFDKSLVLTDDSLYSDSTSLILSNILNLWYLSRSIFEVCLLFENEFIDFLSFEFKLILSLFLRFTSFFIPLK